MNFDWTWVVSLLIFAVSAVIKSRPNVGVWKDKYIPLVQLILALLVQLVDGVLDALPGPVALASFSHMGLMAIFTWKDFLTRLIIAIIQAALPNFSYQLGHQLSKKE